MNRTDAEWEKWGARDPYYGVLTDERFRAHRMGDADREEFFQHGFRHVEAVLRSCRNYFGESFAPRSVLDFGCGVGRLLVPFAQLMPRVVGVDVSPSMLAEARRNCDARDAAHVELVLSDDALSRIDEKFDFVHSTMVLQHIEVPRGRELFRRLLECIRPGGGASLQLTYGKSRFPESWGQPPEPPPPAPPPAPGLTDRIAAMIRPRPSPAPAPMPTSTDPEMHMHSYHLGQIAYLMQSAGANRFHAEFSDHGGELGLTLYLCLPPAGGTDTVAAC